MINARLPAHYERRAIDLDRHAPWLIGCMLEEGDTRDLRWLIRQFGRQRLRRWVAARGARQLSGRSLAFWRLMLEVEATIEPGTEALWPR